MDNWKRMQKTYSTKGLANIVGVHVNTLRFYEKIGFLNQYFPKYMSTPERERIIISLLEKWKEQQDNKN